MKAAWGQFSSITVSISLTAALLGFQSGCALGRKSVSIDSNSRTPFFGLELKERSAKESFPAYRSIAYSTNETARFDVGLPTMGSVKRGAASSRRGSQSTISNVNSRFVQSEIATPSQKDNTQNSALILPVTENSEKSLQSQVRQNRLDFQ